MNGTLHVVAGAVVLGLAAVAMAEPTKKSPSDIVPTLSLPEHPRLLISKSAVADLRKRVDADPLMKQVYESEKKAADALLGLPPVKYEKQGRRLLGVSREALLRITRLAMVHRLSGGARYLDRAKAELLAVAAFEDWNPSHFLDTAEMAMAVAVGYDWLHHGLDEPTRRTLRQALIDKGLRPSFPETGGLRKHLAWVKRENNWNQVCHAGMAFAAITVWEQEPELAAKAVRRAVEMVPAHAMKVYSPDGVYPEGPGYWEYGTMFNVLLIEGLRSAMGSDFGLASFPGFRETGIYQNQVTGPTMQWFNYADCGRGGGSPSPYLMWFAREYDRPDFALFERQRLDAAVARGPQGERMAGAMTLLWFSPKPVAPGQVTMPLSWTGKSENPVAVHRSAWGNAGATYLAVKGGRPNVSHGQQDVGTFVFDADGVRWATDLGMEGYHGIESRGMNLWDMSQGSDRWKIFRQQASAHNVVTIGGRPQDVDGMAPITAHVADGDLPHTVVDLTAVHGKFVKRHQRGAGLADGRRVAVIRDELEGVPAGETLAWAMLTEADVAVDGNVATLKRGDKRLTLTVVAPAGAKLAVTDVSKPANEWDSPNPGVRKVTVAFGPDADGRATVAVELRPASAGKAGAGSRAAAPLAGWSGR